MRWFLFVFCQSSVCFLFVNWYDHLVCKLIRYNIVVQWHQSNWAVFGDSYNIDIYLTPQQFEIELRIQAMNSMSNLFRTTDTDYTVIPEKVTSMNKKQLIVLCHTILQTKNNWFVHHSSSLYSRVPESNVHSLVAKDGKAMNKPEFIQFVGSYLL